MGEKYFVPVFENYYALDEYKLINFNEEIQVSESSYEFNLQLNLIEINR